MNRKFPTLIACTKGPVGGMPLPVEITVLSTEKNSFLY